MFTERGICTRAARAAILTLALGLTACTYGFAGGTGEPNDPYQVATIDDLLAIGPNRDLLTKHFVLVGDIDLDPNLPGGRVFEDALIAPDEYEGFGGHLGEPFSGVFDGQGHMIQNLHIVARNGYDAGLFGKLSGLVKNMRLQDVRISGSPCGAIAGYGDARAVILRCSVTGRVQGSENTGGVVGTSSDAVLMDCLVDAQVTGVKNVGGMIGGGPGVTLIRCESRGNTTGDSFVGGLIGDLREGQIVDSRAGGVVTGRDGVGGLVGSVSMAGSILRSAANCRVTAERAAGGLVGKALRFPPHGQLISDCYALGTVAGSVIGGVIGVASEGRIVNCYAACQTILSVAEAGSSTAAAGGLFGEASLSSAPLVEACFWDMEAAEADFSSGRGRQYPGTGLATELMQQRGTYEPAGWDFGSTWAMSEGGYPVLQWEPAADAGEEADAGQ